MHIAYKNSSISPSQHSLELHEPISIETIQENDDNVSLPDFDPTIHSQSPCEDDHSKLFVLQTL